jgi:uncharacterized protein YjbI with pentapeptide repeats
MQEAVLTKAYAVDANFSNADMTNAVIDRVDFTGVHPHPLFVSGF